MKLPQLSLRDLFWLVLVCALGLGWWVERNRLQSRHQAEKIRINADWETQHYRLIREHEAREYLLVTERKEAYGQLTREQRKNKRSKD
jgi:hypothetical protein